MKTTIFYTVAFLAFLLANSSMALAMSELQCFICQLLLYREYGKISQPQGAHTRS